MHLGPLYHWSPAERRDRIYRYGLLPGQLPTTCLGGGIDYVCLTPDPGRAWALSGAMPWSPAGTWDLWHVRLANQYDVRLRLEDGAVIEVMVGELIPPDLLWLAGSRECATSETGVAS